MKKFLQNLFDEANEWRDKMLEKVAEFDDALMEKYFDDPSTITEEEVLRALRNATVQMAVVPCLWVFISRTKVFRHCLTMFVLSCLLHLDTENVIGTNPNTELKKIVNQVMMKKHQLWHLRSQLTHM